MLSPCVLLSKYLTAEELFSASIFWLSWRATTAFSMSCSLWLSGFVGGKSISHNVCLLNLTEQPSKPLLMTPEWQLYLLYLKKRFFSPHHYFVCARLVLTLTPSMPRWEAAVMDTSHVNLLKDNRYASGITGSKKSNGNSTDWIYIGILLQVSSCFLACVQRGFAVHKLESSLRKTKLGHFNAMLFLFGVFNTNFSLTFNKSASVYSDV